jgi:hypothetical protein
MALNHPTVITIQVAKLSGFDTMIRAFSAKHKLQLPPLHEQARTAKVGKAVSWVTASKKLPYGGPFVHLMIANFFAFPRTFFSSFAQIQGHSL